MKNIKLMSALVLSVCTLTTASGIASAAVVDTTGKAIEKSAGSAGLITDSTSIVDPKIPGGGGGDDKETTGPTNPKNPDKIDPTVKASDLALLGVPAEFNFGITKISAANKVNDLVLKQKKWAITNNIKDGSDAAVTDQYQEELTGKPIDIQSVRVYDGRLIQKDWAVSVSASSFENGTKTLTGATINIKNAKLITNDAKGAVDGKKSFDIATDGTSSTTDVLKASPEARFQSDISWKIDETTLTIPASSVDTGDFSSTVTWTLTGKPDA